MNHQHIHAKGSGLRGIGSCVTTTNPGGPPARLEGMSMSNHTPGPWAIEEQDYGDEHWFGGARCGQITVGEWVAGGYKEQYPEEWEKLRADARLIAAAPELLKACREVEALLGIQCDAGYLLTSSPTLHRLRAAIAKAEGGAS